ncbi:MAG: asparagine synthase (glutamine-hydrolyzing) [Planctomycetaceae bacterium]|jgi:asparagine synthase (glutamine-hydrolysing)|nr:asparagine synthase (glutamine-hydrolyzing) [Planctomycetaceae bacterium]
MCGIAGILRLTTPRGGEGTLPPGEALVPQRWLEVLDRAIAHRGPDGYGVFRDRAVRRDGTVADVALVHRRLAIIDPAGGRQPMVDRHHARGGATAVVFNGHIANHRALRAELCRGGAGFVSDHSDTEVLLRGWRAWGTGLGGRLDGMWAAAIWQGGVGERAGRVWLTRDRAHEKPLYVGEAAATDAHGGRVLVFASTAAAVLSVLAMLGKRPTMTAEQTERWLRFGAAESTGSGCRSWPGRGSVDCLESGLSGHDALARSGLPLERATEAWLDADTVDGMIADAVRLRLDADVPVGCFLSGGVDSGLIAWHAQAALQEAGAGRLRTFTVRMPGADALGGHDESAIAALTAAHVGSEHRVLDCRGSAAQDMVALIEQLGHPLGDSSLLPTAWLSRAVREHVGVALSGDGGDELFGGYDRHVAARWMQLSNGSLGESLASLPPELPAWLLRHRRTAKAGERLGRLRAANTLGTAELRAVFNAEQAADLLGRRPAAQTGMRDALTDDFFNHLGPDLLVKADTASMAVALEVRAPLLGRDLMAACLREPLGSLMPWGRRKGLLRQVAARRLPAEVLAQPKRGFGIPIGRWFREDFGGLRTLLLDHLHSSEPFGPAWLGVGLSVPAARRLVADHLEGRAEHGQRVYVLLAMMVWARWAARLGG